MAFTKKILEVTVQLAPNPESNQPATFNESGTDTATLPTTLRTSVRIENSGAPAGGRAMVTVFGMTESLMDQLSTLGQVWKMIPSNQITIKAGDAESGLSIVFGGTIVQAYGDFNSAPNVPFHFECNAGLINNVLPVAASSYQGSGDVATIMASLARVSGLSFENNGIDLQIANPYYSGSAKTQWERLAADVNINAEIVNGSTLAIWPKGGSRTVGASQKPIVAPPPAGTMIGYPSYTQQGIVVKTIFNPQIVFGGEIEVQSRLKPACGTWAIFKLDHLLESDVPGGKWESTIHAYNPKYPNPILLRS